MPLTFVQQIESAARRIDRQRWTIAASSSFAAIVAALLGLMLLDWLWGVYHPAGRLILSALLLAAIVAVVRWGREAARGRTTPLSVALDLERLHPEHRGLLASGLEFTQQQADDPTAGSLDLRRAAVLRASLAVESIDLSAVTSCQPVRTALVAAITSFAVLCLPIAIAPLTFGTGVARLLNPVSDAEWPRRHDLAFVDPPQLIPAGSDFIAVIRDRRGPLPPAVEVEFRTRRQGRWHYHVQTYQASGDSLEVRWPKVQAPFDFRARGGDHKSMSWQHVDTAPAPQISMLLVISDPPAYTGLPREALREPIRIWAGTKLELAGEVNQEISSARLETEGMTAVPLKIGEDGRSFEAPSGGWRPKSTAEWSIEFTTPAGMTAVADRRLFVEVAADRPPTIEIVEPTQDLAVLQEARIDVQLKADDDLAVKAIGLRVTTQNQPKEEHISIELYRGEENLAQGPPQIDHMLELSSIAPPVGAELQMVAFASDYAGQEAAGLRPLRLRVISREEFIRRAEASRARLVAALERAIAVQRDARSGVEEMLSNVEDVNASKAINVASLQREVRGVIASGRESAIGLSEALASEYRRNQWPDDSAIALIEAVRRAIKTLAANQLAAVGEQLTSVALGAQRSSAATVDSIGSDQRTVLSASLAQQDEIISALESTLRNLSQFKEVYQHQRDLAELKREQSELLKQTETLAREALQNLSDPSMQRRQAQQHAEASQRQLAARLAAALERMKQSAAELTSAKPAEAIRLERAAATAEKSHVQSLVREAADHLGAARFGQATSAQRAALEQLQVTLNRMSQSGAHAAEERLASLKEAEEQLKELRREVDALLAQQSQRNERDLAEQTTELAEELEQLQAEEAAQLAKEAAEQLAGDRALSESTQSVQQKLDDAREELAEASRRQEDLLSKMRMEEQDTAIRGSEAEQQAVESGTKPGEASAAAPTTATAPIDRSAISNLVKEVWGSLPERQREELLQPLSEEFLPGYAEEIEEYFRALAESPPDGGAVEEQR